MCLTKHHMHEAARTNSFFFRFSIRSVKTICWPVFNGNDHWTPYLIRSIRIWALGNEIFYLSWVYVLLKFWIFGFMFTTNKCQTQVNGTLNRNTFRHVCEGNAHTHTHSARRIRTRCKTKTMLENGCKTNTKKCMWREQCCIENCTKIGYVCLDPCAVVTFSWSRGTNAQLNTHRRGDFCFSLRSS